MSHMKKRMNCLHSKKLNIKKKKRKEGREPRIGIFTSLQKQQQQKTSTLFQKLN